MLRGIRGLLLLSVVGGSIISWILFPTPAIVCLPIELKTLALTVSLAGGWLGYELAKFKVGEEMKSIQSYGPVVFIGSMWFIPFLSTYGVSGVPLAIGSHLVKSIDQGWSETFGGQGLYSSLQQSSVLNQWLQDNNLKVYLTIFIFWVIILVGLSAACLNSLYRA
jgi:NADH-ubiquinone oxidoreductase chain 5